MAALPEPVQLAVTDALGWKPGLHMAPPARPRPTTSDSRQAELDVIRNAPKWGRVLRGVERLATGR